MPLIEACVTDLPETLAAVEAGAQRLELCRDLESGGLTPTLDVFEAVRDRCGCELYALVRPNAKSFRVDARIVDEMLREIELLAAAGAGGVVVGAIDRKRRIDVPAIAELVAAAQPRSVTFHRAFDHALDLSEALEVLIELGVDRVLTSGGAPTAWEGRDRLRDLVQQADDRITVMAGGAIRAGHGASLVRHTGVREVHARAIAIPELAQALR